MKKGRGGRNEQGNRREELARESEGGISKGIGGRNEQGREREE